MKLEKHRYDDIVILKFVGEFDSFNLPQFGDRINGMIAGGDTNIILDLYLLRFINSAALGYLIKTRKAVEAAGGELVLARPSKFVKKTLSTLGLETVFKMFDSVETAIMHYKRGADIGEISLEGGEYDESLTGSTPILFRPAEGESPNQVGRIVTLYEDGLLFRYEPEQKTGHDDPVAAFLKAGSELKMKFRQPFAVKDYYFEMQGHVVEVMEMAGGGDEDEGGLAARVRYEHIKDEDRKHLEQFVRDQEEWRAELSS